MAKIVNPHSLSGHFKIPSSKLTELGVLDSTFSADTRLFVDPLLFAVSKHSEFKDNAVSLYRIYFETVIKFLVAAKTPDDIGFRTARRMLGFRELSTCLGYGATSDAGSAWGPELVEQVLKCGKQIVDLGITDPDLFASMALFEERIGADRISDMATNVALHAFIAFNRRIIEQLGLPFEEFEIGGERAAFVRNPYLTKRTPVILVPSDVLRKLPIAGDWDAIAYAAYENEAIRARVNKDIGYIWTAKIKRDKEKLRDQALSAQEHFRTLLDAIHAAPRNPYDVANDPDGLATWAARAREVADSFPLDLSNLKNLGDLSGARKVVQAINERFKFLIEMRGLNRELYREGGDPRNESTAQRLYFAVAYCYCEANNLDLSPEVDTGSGKIDFKFSKGFDVRVVVEIKLSRNPKILAGFQTQLETYKAAEQTTHAAYLVIDVGNMGKKDRNLIQLRNAASALGDPISDLIFIDGIIRPSASKR